MAVAVRADDAATRRLVGSYNLGSMANAMPQALGAQALDRDAPGRRVLRRRRADRCCSATCITAVTYDLPVKLVVFDNGRLGMVKLEQEQGGLPEFGTVLRQPRPRRRRRARSGLHGVRVERPARRSTPPSREALAHPGPVLLDVVTNPDEVAVPPKPTLAQGWGFAIAKSREFLDSHGS